MGLITLSKNFCHWTISVVIAGHLAKTNNKIWRAFWSVLLILTIIAFCLHCALNVMEYLSYEKTTIIRLYSLPSAPFPAVAICNLNPFKKSALDKSSSLSNLISAYKYTLDKKATTTESTAIITTSPTEKKVRRKRETCPVDGVSSVKAPSASVFETYTVSNCDGTYFDLMYNMCDTSTVWNIDHILITDFNANKDIIEKGFFTCAHDTICTDDCSGVVWDSGYTALLSISECAKNNFTFPPATGEFNIAVQTAKIYAQNCLLPDEACDFGYYKKPSTKYPANYWYVACESATSGVNDVSITMEGCDGIGGTLFNRNTTSLTPPTPPCPINYQTISDHMSSTLDDTDCKASCGMSCPYTSTGNNCDTNQPVLCNFYKACASTTTEESIITSTQEQTTIMMESTTDQGLPMSTTVPIQSTTIDGSGSITTTTIGVVSTTPIPVQSTTMDQSFSTTNGASTTEAIASTTLNPSTTPDLDTTTNILTTTPLVTSTFEPSSSSNEQITTSALFTTKLSTILSTSKEITTIAPTSTKIITPSTVLPSSTDSLTSVVSSTEPSLETTTAIEKTSTEQTTNAAIILSTILSTPSNLPTTTNALAITSTNPNTAESTVIITSTPIVTMPLTSKASPTTEKLSTTPAVTTTNESPSVSSTNIKTISFLTTADNSGSSTLKISTSLAATTIKASSSQTQQVSSSMASTNDLLNTSPTSVVAITASSKSETSGILSTSNPFITTISSKDTTSVTKNLEIDSTTPSSLDETPSTKNDGSDSQTSTNFLTTQKQNSLPVTSKVVTNGETTPTQNSDLDSQTTNNFFTTQTQNSFPVTSNAITPPSTETLDPSMTSSSNAIIESSSSSLPNQALQTTMESDVTENVFTSSLSYDNSITTNIIDPNYSVATSTVNDDFLSSRKTSLFPITFLPTTNNGITNNLETTKATAMTSFFNTPQGSLSSTTLDSLSQISNSLNPTSDTATTENLSSAARSGRIASGNDSDTDLSTSSDNIITPTTPSTNNIGNTSNKTNNETQSDPSMTKNSNQSANTTLPVNSNQLSSSNPFQTTLSIPSSNNSDTTTQSSTDNEIKSLTDSYGNIITKDPSNSNDSNSNNYNDSNSINSNSDSNNSNSINLNSNKSNNSDSNSSDSNSNDSNSNDSNSNDSNSNDSNSDSNNSNSNNSNNSDSNSNNSNSNNTNSDNANSNNTNSDSNNSNSNNSNNSNNFNNSNNSDNSNSNNTNSDSNNSNSNNFNSDISGGDSNQFNLSSLSFPLSTNDLEALSKIYNLNSSQDTITIETNAQNSLITIAASLTDAEKDALGYKLPELIQTCLIDGVLCDIERDFSQIYDVDYGYCYTFNHDFFYNTTRMGTDHGLKLVVLSAVNEYLATTSEQGVKVVVHYQDQSPFPNIDGYRSGTGKAVDLRVTYGIVSRLDAPYGECNDLDKLKELNQPFYYPGTYTVEGCYRSCFQQKISKACNCSDSRFPLPSDLSTTFCQNTDTVKYACYEKYIEDNGDYFNVEDCTCAIPCNDITYSADAYYSNWPYGTYFFQALCTNSTLLNGTDCRQYYQDNAVLVQVNYAKMGYESMEETPVTSGFDLFNNLAGNTGLWIGFTAVTAAEFALLFIQISLWIFTKKAELKEVPSCRRRNYTSGGDLDKQKENNNAASKGATIVGVPGPAAQNSGIHNNPFQKSFYNDGFNGLDERENFDDHLHIPKNFANTDLRRRRNSHFATATTLITDPSSLYESIKPVNHVDVYDSQLVAPTHFQSAINESIP